MEKRERSWKKEGYDRKLDECMNMGGIRKKTEDCSQKTVFCLVKPPLAVW